MERALADFAHADALRAIVGARYVLEQEASTSSFLKDWTGDYVSKPYCVILPATTKDVSEVVRYCASNGLHVIPQGGNTGLVGGCHTENDEQAVILNLQRMSKIRKLDATNYSVEVEAGCIVQRLQDQAQEADRLFPLSFGAEGSAQIGGAIATNAGGLNVLRYGMMRDLVLGLEVVLADGTILSTLNQLRKDNRGFDKKQLFIGTEGALGIITAATLKLLPRITNSETAVLALESVEDVVQLYSLARTHCADLMTAFELIPRACLEMALEHQHGLRDPLDGCHENYVIMEMACSGPLNLRELIESFFETAMNKNLIADGALAESLTQAQAFWSIREAMVEAQAAQGRHLRTDISVPVSVVPTFIVEAQSCLAEAAPGWLTVSYGHVGDGNIHFNALPPAGTPEGEVKPEISRLLRLIYPIVDALGGSISAEHGIGRSRLADHQMRQSEADQNITAGVKHLLDPNMTLNPGCLFPAPAIGEQS